MAIRVVAKLASVGTLSKILQLIIGNGLIGFRDLASDLLTRINEVRVSRLVALILMVVTTEHFGNLTERITAFNRDASVRVLRRTERRASGTEQTKSDNTRKGLCNDWLLHLSNLSYLMWHPPQVPTFRNNTYITKPVGCRTYT